MAQAKTQTLSLGEGEESGDASELNFKALKKRSA